jgi:hypothetical protein
MFSNTTGAPPLLPSLTCGFASAPLRIIDDWRRRQPDLPARSEAIRRARSSSD